MIISHSRKFIFIKTVKTAGTSLEMVLSKYCEEGDILAPLEPREEAQRQAIAGITGQGHLKPVSTMRLMDIARYVRYRNRQYRLRGREVARYQEHSSASKVRSLVGEDVWNDYFTFAVVRHPFDRLVSRFYYTSHYENENDKVGIWDHDDFDQFLRYRTNLINENWRLITEKDQVLVDYVVHYEALEEDLGEVSKKIGLEHNIYEDLRRIKAKGGIRPKRAGLELSENQRALIELLCKKEMETFGYAAESPATDHALAKPATAVPA